MPSSSLPDYGETHTEKEECAICGDPIQITVTEDGKALPDQYKTTRSGKKAHHDCVRKRGYERMNHNPNLRP